MITKHCRHVSIDRGTSCVIVQPATNTYSRVTLQVIEVLKQRGEKAHLVLATHELGDVHAHFGNWRGPPWRGTTHWTCCWARTRRVVRGFRCVDLLDQGGSCAAAGNLMIII